MREKLEWTVLLATGAWLSIQIARRLTEVFATLGTEDPVRVIVAEALSEREQAESPMVQAFAEALESAENGVGAAT